MSFSFQPKKNTITIMAGSAIAAGSPVAINSSGKIEPIRVNTSGPPFAWFSSAQGAGFSANVSAACWVPLESAWVAITNSGIQVATVDPVYGPSFGALYAPPEAQSGPVVFTLPGSRTIIFVYSSGATNFRAVAATISGTVVTFGTPVTLTGIVGGGIFTTSQSGAGVDSSRFIFACGDSNAGYTTGAASVSGTAITVGAITLQSAGVGTTAVAQNCLWCNNAAAFMWRNNATGTLYTAGASLSGTTLTYTVPATEAVASTNLSAVVFDPVQNQLVYALSTSGGVTSLRTATVSSSTGITTVSTSGTIIADAFLTLMYDTTNSRVVISGVSISQTALRIVAFTNNGSTLTQVRSDTLLSSYSSNTPMIYANALDRFLWPRGGGALTIYYSILGGSAGSNALNYIGAVAAAVAINASGDVYTPGSALSTPVALNIAVPYIVNACGGWLQAPTGSTPRAITIATNSMLLQ